MNISEIKASKRKDRDTWEYTFHVNKKRYRRSGFKTKSEALRKAHTHVDEIVNQNTIDKNILFKDYYNDWIELYKKSELSKGQYYWYTRSLDLFIEFFGKDKLLKNVTKADYQKLLNWYGKGRSKSTVEKLHVCISQVLREAHHEGILKSDPTFKAQLNYTKQAMKEDEKYLNLNDYLKLIDYLKSRSEKSYLLLYILAITGGRFSEVNRMTLDDLHFDSIHLPGTKTANADRTVGVSAKDIEHIRNQLRDYPVRIDRKIFDISHRASLKSFKHALKTLNINNNYTPYALRHTHCSYLLSQGIPIEYISKRLGHSNIRMTLEVYSHLLDEYKEENDDKVRQLFS